MDLMEQLVKIIEQLGWSVAIPEADEEEDVPGLIIGTQEYVSAVTGRLPEGQFWKRDREAN
jgi:hypothetical protein